MLNDCVEELFIAKVRYLCMGLFGKQLNIAGDTLEVNMEDRIRQ